MQTVRMLGIAIGVAASGCWSSRVVAPAVAGEPESTGYGVMMHTINAGLAAGSLTSVGVVAHSPADGLGEAGDSLWQVVDRTEMELCFWSKRGEPQCARATWDGDPPKGDPIRIIDPVNLGAVLQTSSAYNAQTGQMETSSNNVPIFLVESADMPSDRGIWILSGNSRAMYRCAMGTDTKPTCRKAQM